MTCFFHWFCYTLVPLRYSLIWFSLLATTTRVTGKQTRRWSAGAALRVSLIDPKCHQHSLNFHKYYIHINFTTNFVSPPWNSFHCGRSLRRANGTVPSRSYYERIDTAWSENLIYGNSGVMTGGDRAVCPRHAGWMCFKNALFGIRLYELSPQRICSQNIR